MSAKPHHPQFNNVRLIVLLLVLAAEIRHLRARLDGQAAELAAWRKPTQPVPDALRAALAAPSRQPRRTVHGLLIDGIPIKAVVVHPRGSSDPARDQAVWNAIVRQVREDRRGRDG